MQKKKISKIICLIYIFSVICVMLTGCNNIITSKVAEANSQTEVEQSIKLLKSSFDMYKSDENIQNMRTNIDFNINMSSVKGKKINLEGIVDSYMIFGNQQRAEIKVNLGNFELNGQKKISSLSNKVFSLYFDEEGIVLSIDSGEPIKISYELLKSFSILNDEKINRLLSSTKKFTAFKEAVEEGIIYEINKNVKFRGEPVHIDITKEQKDKIFEIASPLISWFGGYKIEGETEVDGRKAIIVKGAIDKNKLIELKNAVEKVMESGVVQGLDIIDFDKINDIVQRLPKDSNLINVIFYVDKETKYLAGCDLEFAGFLSEISLNSINEDKYNIGECKVNTKMQVNSNKVLNYSDLHDISIFQILELGKQIAGLFGVDSMNDIFGQE